MANVWMELATKFMHERLMLRASPNETHPALRRLGQCPDAVDREARKGPCQSQADSHCEDEKKNSQYACGEETVYTDAYAMYGWFSH